MSIGFQNNDYVFILKNKTVLRAWIQEVIKKEKKKLGTINYVFTSDESLLKTNIQFLNHNTYTDIITFDYCENGLINGDIQISVERVRDNSKKFECSFEQELHRVMIHGVLHLCGYKDKSKKDGEVMRSKENGALRLLKKQYLIGQ